MMRRLADFRGLFDDEKEEEFLAEEEAEGWETDEEGGSPSVREGSLPPLTADPPLPAGSPPPDVTPLPPSTPAGAPSEGQHASADIVPTTGMKRVREGMCEPSAGPLRVTRRRIEEVPIESRAVPDEQEVVPDQVAGLGFEEVGRSTMDADPSQSVEEGARSPLVKEHRDQAAGLVSDEAVRTATDVDPSKQDDEEGDGSVGDGEFAHSLEEGNEHGFKFAYNGLSKSRLLGFPWRRGSIRTHPCCRSSRVGELSYEASDFELHADLGLDSLIDFMVGEPDERADDVQDGSGRADGEVAEEETAEDEVAEDEEAGDEVAGDEVVGDANLPEESETVRRDE
ncbi:unnamed protein product [Cochlearia groenlandica]